MEKAFEFFYSNLDVLIVLVVGVISLTALLTGFLLLPATDRISKIKQWMKYAVMDAENDWHEGTGELKLGTVYAAFLLRFPIVAKLVPYSVFKILVDKALDQMVEIFNANPTIECAVKKIEVCETADPEIIVLGAAETGIYIPEESEEEFTNDSMLLDEACEVESMPEEVINITEIPEEKIDEINTPINE